MARSIFAVEVCAPLLPGSPFQNEIRALVQGHPAASSFHDKAMLYRRVTELLLWQLPSCERGCWDFFDDDDRAQRDYRMWCDGMLTAEGARTEPSGAPDAYRGEPRYLTLTIAFLLTQGTPSERMLAARCNIHQSALWRRGSFHQVIASIPEVSFTAVEGDVIYMIPRDPDWGLTREDLALPKFHYLRTIEG